MKGAVGLRCSLRVAVLGVALVLLGVTTGCQVDIGGQTLPSPYWFSDDVQYFAPGPEFKLAREAAAMAEAAEAQMPIR